MADYKPAFHSRAMLGADQSAVFLRDRWQRRPTFFARAMPTLPALPDWRSLVAKDSVESRRIVTTEPNRYMLRDGPFDGPDPDAPWTVLLQDAEHHAPTLRGLIDAIDFLPHWRLEDVMMSVATAGGSVGPHVDAYDVFLVQAQGTRQWDIGRTGDYQRIDDDSGLRLVESFSPERSLTARPGDVLYLPPDVPHHGVALDDCVTYSIGFRAPTLRDIATVALDHQTGEDRYRDAGTERAADPALIDAATLARLRQQLQAFLTLSDHALATAMGELMTEPKPWLLDDAAASTGDPAVGPRRLELSPGTRVARYQDTDGSVFFANGQSYAVTSDAAATMLRTLAATRHAPYPDEPDCRQLVDTLLDDAIVRIIDEHNAS